MSRLSEAQDRLEAALERLEQVSHESSVASDEAASQRAS
jgi:hypothetical protein